MKQTVEEAELVFLDSNILVYAVTSGDPRQQVALDLLSDGGAISVQVLNEFANVARRKLGFSWREVARALTALRACCSAPMPLSLKTHERALVLAERYGFSFYDALIVASALEAECDTLHSEDMHDGLFVDGMLKISNPFLVSR